MRKFKIILLIVLTVFLTNISVFSQDSSNVNIYDNLLKKYVFNGLVDYDNLSKDKNLDKYIDALSNFNPNTLNDKKTRLAFWINAYNAYTLKVIVDNYPISSINELHTGGKIIAHILKKTVWDKDFVVINNKKMTLNHIEHEIIRAKFKDPRIHFALVCGAISCPPLRNEAFVGSKLNEQLDDQARKFFADPSKNTFDGKNRVAHLSKILDWYGSDFGENDSQILDRIKNYLPKQIAESINDKIIKWEIDFKSYDWDLNKIKKN